MFTLQLHATHDTFQATMFFELAKLVDRAEEGEGAGIRLNQTQIQDCVKAVNNQVINMLVVSICL